MNSIIWRRCGRPPCRKKISRGLCNQLPLIEGTTANWPDRLLFTHKGRWKTGEEPNKFKLQNFAVRNQRFRFVGNNALYDMVKDPSQTKNVVEEHPQLVADMRAAYEEFWKETRPLMVNEDVPMSPTRPYHELYRKQMESTGIPDWETPAL